MKLNSPAAQTAQSRTALLILGFIKICVACFLLISLAMSALWLTEARAYWPTLLSLPLIALYIYIWSLLVLITKSVKTYGLAIIFLAVSIFSFMLVVLTQALNHDLAAVRYQVTDFRFIVRTLEIIFLGASAADLAKEVLKRSAELVANGDNEWKYWPERTNKQK